MKSKSNHRANYKDCPDFGGTPIFAELGGFFWDLSKKLRPIFGLKPQIMHQYNAN